MPDRLLAISGGGFNAPGRQGSCPSWGATPSLAGSVMSRIAPSLLVVLAMTPTPVWAQGGLDVQRFRPPPGPHALMTVDRARVGEHLQPGVGLWINHGAEPLVQHHPDGRREPLVDGQTGFDLTGAVGLWDRAEVGFALPLSGTDEAFGAGDVRLSGKIRILGSEAGDATAIRAEVSLPTGDAATFQGSDAVGVAGWYVPTWVLGPLDLSVNAGLSYRPSVQLEALESGTELHLGVGAGVDVLPDRGLRLAAELNGSTGVSSLDALRSGETKPVETLVGAHVPLFEGFHATAGAGVAVTEGYGTPSWRVIVGAYWAPRITWDRDDDGLPDEVDKCPELPEDKDGIDDDDGCPEDDVDGDGVADAEDKCPRRPEDMDGFEDDDGCPDVDNDQDLIADATDKCPNEAEDRDGHDDDDGCPDPDDDGDGVLDAQDKCPAHKEDRDGFEDDDGCPDEDDDRDGFADEVDRCPRQAEVYNGIDDDDGCPDGEEESAVTVTEQKLEITQKIYFKFESDEIKKKSFPLLKQVGGLLNAHPKIKTVLIEGHSDALGDDRLNRRLSKKRAKRVKKFLVRKVGVPDDRLVVEGFGANRPQASNDTRKGRAKNRRVQFLIMQWDHAATRPAKAASATVSDGDKKSKKDKKDKKKKKKKKKKKRKKKR